MMFQNLKPVLLLVAAMCIESTASNQLTFSTDSIDLESHYNTDTLVIGNKTDSTISIDTIRYTWKISGVKQVYSIGMMFDTVNTRNGYGYAAYSIGEVKKGVDSSFTIYTKVNNQQISVKPKSSLSLKNFAFGKCILCAGISSGQSENGRFSIKTVFINNRGGKDTVVFTGQTSVLISSGISENRAANFRIANKRSPWEHVFLASGRKIAGSKGMNHQKTTPLNLYFTRSARVPMKLK